MLDSHCLKHRDTIKDARSSQVPASTFGAFCELPSELQIRIWRLAASTKEPSIHRVARISEYRRQPNKRYTTELASALFINSNIMVLRHVCHNSQMVFDEVFTYFPVTTLRKRSDTYFNTISDTFYLANDTWTEYPALTSLFKRRSATQTLPPEIHDDIQAFTRIRSLMVDLPLFATMPKDIWTEFPDLRRLFIFFYPIPIVKADNDYLRELRSLNTSTISKPLPGSPYWKRVRWIVQSVLEILQDVKMLRPNWTIPQVLPLTSTRAPDDDDDENFQKSCSWDCQDPHHIPLVECDPLWTDEKRIGQDEQDDCLWFQQATKMMSTSLDL